MSPAAPALPRKKLHIGIQTLAKLRDQDCCYVEKSRLAIDQVDSTSQSLTATRVAPPCCVTLGLQRSLTAPLENESSVALLDHT